MINFRASYYNFSELLSDKSIKTNPFPLLRNDEGSELIYCVSPLHGRSFVVNRNGERWIISKGNGLSYSSAAFLDTSKVNGDL